MVRKSPKVINSVAAGAALLILAAACGGSNDSGSGQAGSGGGASGGTVSAKNISGVGNVLVDSSGKALYFSEQEMSGTIMCTKDCTDIWVPLTVPDGTSNPTAGSGVSGKLGTLKRPDGAMQVTLDGKPLYRFSLDKSAGQVGGNTSDSFGGTSFTWHVATADGSVVSSSPSSGGGAYY